jgi:hypothetical protein
LHSAEVKSILNFKLSSNSKELPLFAEEKEEEDRTDFADDVFGDADFGDADFAFPFPFELSSAIGDNDFLTLGKNWLADSTFLKGDGLLYTFIVLRRLRFFRSFVFSILLLYMKNILFYFNFIIF